MLCNSLMRPHERMTFRQDDAAEENYDGVCLRARDHQSEGNGRSC